MDSSTSGDHATVGSSWDIIQANIDGAVIGPASSTDNGIVRYNSTTGTLIQDSLATIDDNGSINIPSGQKYKINNNNLDATDVGAEPTISSKNTAFNKNFGSTPTDVKINGTQAVGSIDEIARIDHVHPIDSTRAELSHTHSESEITSLVTDLSSKLKKSPVIITVGSSDCDYTNISAALAAITDASATKQYCIIGYGNVEDTSLITWKSYVDLQGIGLNWNINTATNGLGLTLTDLVRVTIQDVIIRRNGTVTVASSVIRICGNCDKTVKIINLTAYNEISAVVAGCHGIQIDGTCTSILRLCHGYGGGATYSCGIYIISSAAPELISCTGFGGNGGNNCWGVCIGGASSPLLTGCTGIGGNGGTSCRGFYINESCSPIMTSCLGKYPTFMSYHEFTGSNSTILPFSGKPYFLQSIYVAVGTPGAAGSTLSIGTSAGGSQIASAIPMDSAGGKYFAFIPQAFAADATIYLTFSDVATRATIFYSVGYNFATTQGLYNDTLGMPRFLNCSFLGNMASVGLYVSTQAMVEACLYSNCMFKTAGSTSYSVQGASAGKINAKNCTFVGPLLNAIPEGKVINIPMFESSSSLLLENPGTSYTELTPLEKFRSAVDFTYMDARLVRVAISGIGNETGTKGIEIFNVTDGSTVCSVTWTASTQQNALAGSWTSLALSTAKTLAIRVKGFSAAEDISLDKVVLQILEV